MEWRVQTYDHLESTQDHLLACADQEDEGRVIQSLSQGGGRGTHGRIWDSPAGNLYLSMLLRPGGLASQTPGLAVLAAVSVAQVIVPSLDVPESLRLKWPNDILIEEEKCGGILIDVDLIQNRAVNWVVIGLGLNIDVSPLALSTALNEHVKTLQTVSGVRDLFLNRLAENYKCWKNKQFDPIKAAWALYGGGKLQGNIW